MLYEQVKLSPRKHKASNPFCDRLLVVYGCLPGNETVAWGIDPGVHFGLTIIDRERVFVIHGSFLRMDKPGLYGLTAYMFLSKLIKQFGHAYKAGMVIEGAAYGVPFRQVELSEIRTGLYIAGAQALPEVQIIPPLSIRKKVFGKGGVQAADVWPLLHHNAADSLSMALYAAMERSI